MDNTTEQINSELLSAFQSQFIPNDNRPIYIWANEYVSLNSGYSITGKFDTSISPHFKKVFDSFQDPYVREVNILAPPRSGKTLISEICLLHTIANSSGDILFIQETEEQAKKMSDLRMVPLLHSCKPVTDLIDTNSKYNITDNRYKFLHSTVHVTSPKPSTMNSVGYKTIFFDEAWTCRDNTIIKDIKRRADDYKGVSKCMFFSQGGLKDSAWFEQYNSGEIYEYGWKCPKCATLQNFEWSKKREDGTYSGIVWPNNNTTRDTNNKWIIRECAKQSVLECHCCRYQVNDNPQNRKYLLDSGEYIRTNPSADVDSTVKSFRFTNLCNVKISFGELTSRYLLAKQKRDFFGSTEDLQHFLNKDMADFWDEYQKKSRVDIKLAEYDTAKPFGDFEAKRFLTIDVQKDEYYFVVRSWTSNGESRLVDYGTCKTPNEIEAVRERNKVDYRFVFVDVAEGPRRESLLSELVKHGRWGNFDGEEIWLCYNALRGDKGRRWTHSDNKVYRYKETTDYAVGQTGNEEDKGKTVNHISFSSFAYSQILETLRDGKGKKWEARDVSQEYTNHLNSEVLQRKLKGNIAEFEYVCKPNTANHYWDCEKMNVVAADIWELLDAGLLEQTTDNPNHGNSD